MRDFSGTSRRKSWTGVAQATLSVASGRRRRQLRRTLVVFVEVCSLQYRHLIEATAGSISDTHFTAEEASEAAELHRLMRCR